MAEFPKVRQILKPGVDIPNLGKVNDQAVSHFMQLFSCPSYGVVSHGSWTQALGIIQEKLERDGIRRPVLLADVAEFDPPAGGSGSMAIIGRSAPSTLGMDLLPAFVFKVTPPVASRH
ncbi:hypothetical protein [Geothrix mesophila]|uniref:hypothetical protein n=1 Tax=Geothrix mesophila TaxID=2922723 RepID=UPI001FACA5EE|nr:hypothetical protein [Geothrix sp. SG198]